jgi:hypothetical protein
MSSCWGDESWKDAAYTTKESLFEIPEKESNETIAKAFGQRLRKVAGFARVPEPLPMRNAKGAIVYYLFFAAQVEVAEDIVRDIFTKYRTKGEV